MSSLEPLITHIYHEKQQEGSMLCAQHALNALLQGDYFSAADLSSIARSLDTLEQGVMEGNLQASTNMDDTGFFSVQVLENALHVWGLSLVRWRSENMRPYHDQPHNQLAFVLNLSQHWFTLRRFGGLSPHIEVNEHTNGHWFNLNSYLERPEWVSKTYLGMVISQAETEGYSVFAVVQTDPESPLALPRTQADDIASTLPEASGSTTNSAAQASFGFEDEDYELQAALQASLGGYDELPPHVAPQRNQGEALISPPVIPVVGGPQDRIVNPNNSRSTRARTGLSLDSFDANRQQSASNLLPPLEDASDDDDEEFVDAASHPASRGEEQVGAEEDNEDPMLASMARQRLMLERMRREQEAALHEQYEDEMAAFADPARMARRREEEEEAEMLRRAIAESEAEARERERAAAGPQDRVDAHDEDMDIDQADASQRAWLTGGHRVYDDDDAQLQAALRASLETVPVGFRIPDTPPPPSIPLAPTSTSTGPFSAQHDEADKTSTAGTETETEPDDMTDEPPQEENVSVEEMRRRRLARFGGA